MKISLKATSLSRETLDFPILFKTTDGKSFELVKPAKDLRVFIDSSFKPSLQCREGYARARATFVMVLRGFAMLTPAIF